jgi:ubiquitin carboxyl-terminal hydrolase L3
MSRPIWIPLEASPDVFNSYASSLGFSTDSYAFTDIWGLDPDLLAFVPQPVKAVLLLFPTTEARHAKNKADDAKGELVLSSEVEEVKNGGTLWIPQTIGNACGTMVGGTHPRLHAHTRNGADICLTCLQGMLHALANAGVEIPEDAPLRAFFDDCRSSSSHLP